MAACAVAALLASPAARADDPPPPWADAAKAGGAPGGEGVASGGGNGNGNGQQGAGGQSAQANGRNGAGPQGNGNQNRGAAGPGAPAPALAQPIPPLGLIQRAWDAPGAHLGSGQAAPGLKRAQWSAGFTIPIITREGMTTTISLPQDDTVSDTRVSDKDSFEDVTSWDKRSVAIKPIYVGVDASYTVFGSTGRIYSYYLRSVPWDNATITDLIVIMSAAGAGSAAGGGAGAGAGGSGGSGGGSGSSGSAAAYDGPAYDDDPSARLTMRPRAQSARVGQDYAARALTGNGRIRKDLAIKVARPEDSIIAPVAAWRDDRFTYLDFGPRAASMNLWPSPSLVVDGVDSPVGTRVSGPNRSVMVVEALGNITLSSGSRRVCIVVDTINGDTRFPAVDKPYRSRAGSLSTSIDVRAPSAALPRGMTGPGTGDFGLAAER